MDQIKRENLKMAFRKIKMGLKETSRELDTMPPLDRAQYQISESKKPGYTQMLTDEYSYVNGHLYYKSTGDNVQRVSNGFPIAKALKVSVNPDGSKRVILNFSFFIGGIEQQDMFEHDVDKLSDFNFDSYYKMIIDPLCVRARNHFVKILKESIKLLKADNKLYFSKLGWEKTQYGIVYVAGKTVISKNGALDPDIYEVDSKLKDMELEADCSLQISIAVKKLLKLFIKYPEASLIYIYNLATSIKSLFIEAGSDNWFSVLLVGATEIGKTTVSCYLANMFNRTRDKRYSVVGLDDSKNFIYDQSDYFRDAVLILDDLNTSLSKETKRKKEYTFGEIIQCVANGYNRSTTKKSTAFNSGLIATAEYAIKNISTLNRTLLITLKHHIFPREEFSVLSAETKFMSTIHYHFLIWAAGNYDWIVDYIMKQKIFLEKYKLSSHDRINDSVLTMSITGLLFHSFCKSCCGETLDIVDQAKEVFQRHLERTVRLQDDFIKKIQLENKEHNFAEIIFKLYSSGKLDIGRKNLNKHDAVEKKGHLIITTDKLHRILLTVLKESEFSARSVCKQLSDRGLLSTDDSMQMKSTKKYNNRRALFIDLKHLEKYCLESKAN